MTTDTDDRWREGYARARAYYGDHPRAALKRIHERLLDMAAAKMPRFHRDQLLELAQVANTALGEGEL